MADPIIDAAATKDPAPAAPPSPAPTQPTPIVASAPTAPPVQMAQAVAPPPQPSPDLSALQRAADEVDAIRKQAAAAHKRDVDERRLAKLRSMGLRVDASTLSETEVLALAPVEDPYAPGADVAYEAFRTARPGFFAPREKSLGQRVAEIESLKNPRFKDTKILNFTKVAETILGGTGGRR